MGISMPLHIITKMFQRGCHKETWKVEAHLTIQSASVAEEIETLFHKNSFQFSSSNRCTTPCAAFHVALKSRSGRQILVHVSRFVKKPKIPSPALNNESIPGENSGVESRHA